MFCGIWLEFETPPGWPRELANITILRRNADTGNAECGRATLAGVVILGCIIVATGAIGTVEHRDDNHASDFVRRWFDGDYCRATASYYRLRELRGERFPHRTFNRLLPLGRRLHQQTTEQLIQISTDCSRITFLLEAPGEHKELVTKPQPLLAKQHF